MAILSHYLKSTNRLVLAPLEALSLHEASSFFDLGMLVVRNHLRGPDLDISSFSSLLDQFAPHFSHLASDFAIVIDGPITVCREDAG